MPTRAQLLAYADANFDDNNIGGIEGLELNTSVKDIINSAVIKDEAGDVSGGLSFASGVLTIVDGALTIAKTSGLQPALDAKVAGPASVTSGLPAVFSGTSGKIIASVTFAAFKASLAIAAADVSGLSAFATSTDLANATGLLALARITGGADNTLLRMNGANVVWGLVNNNMVGVGQIGLDKLASQAAGTIVGNVAGGSASPTALTGAQVKSLMTFSDTDIAPTFNNQPNDYTFILGDTSRWVRHNSGTPHTYTVPPQASVPWLIGARIGIMSISGNVTVQAGSGVAFRIAGSTPVTFQVPAGMNVVLVLVDTNVWEISENIVLSSGTLWGNDSGLTALARAMSATAVKTMLAIGAADVSGLAAIATSGSADHLGSGTVPAARISGNYSMALLTLSDRLQLTNHRIDSTAASMFIRALTADNNDNAVTLLCGGGDSGATRGAWIGLYGNEYSGQPGRLDIAAGITATVANIIGGGGAGAVLSILGTPNADGSDNSATHLAGGGTANLTRGGYLSVYGNEFATDGGKFLLIAGDTVNGSLIRGGVGASSITMQLASGVGSDQGFIAIGAGGTVPDISRGSYVISYGADHSSQASNLLLVAGTGGRVIATGTVVLNQGQLLFPGTQNPSTDANNQDDYEEGTFTPALTFATPPTGLTYSFQGGAYTKIGRAVIIHSVRVILTSKGTGGAGVVQVTLPFSNGTHIATSTVARWSGGTLPSSGTHMFFLSANGGASMSAQCGVNTTAGIDVTWADIQNAFNFITSIMIYV